MAFRKEQEEAEQYAQILAGMRSRLARDNAAAQGNQTRQEDRRGSNSGPIGRPVLTGVSNAGTFGLVDRPRYFEATGRFSDPPQYWQEPGQAVPGEVATEVIDEEAEEDDELDEDEVEDEGMVWKLGEPQPQPLYYQIPTANGGFEDRLIHSNVDFNSRDSVNKANKQRRLEQYRAKKRHGLQHQLLRPGTKGHEYSQAHDTFISQQHQSYAAANGNRRIPWSILTNNFNGAFPGQNRTKNSLSSLVDQRAGLKRMRAQYDGADDE
ncbi:hypothetical protein LTR78_006900 [Recurvomyces mirabilis]|uniref:Uncharacterized protein n=1 Tax=Recurvomyces mirabilis TaxID=574656 RepID=A0AAE0WKF3_9PEZI|nr:hypothetical protein LTR78_006900 [Recurvomyces mirabilis]KAK5153109.1 hypothetical protein LTS14_007753 [Recurvomyces mirabilis]